MSTGNKIMNIIYVTLFSYVLKDIKEKLNTVSLPLFYF